MIFRNIMPSSLPGSFRRVEKINVFCKRCGRFHINGSVDSATSNNEIVFGSLRLSNACISKDRQYKGTTLKYLNFRPKGLCSKWL